MQIDSNDKINELELNKEDINEISKILDGTRKVYRVCISFGEDTVFKHARRFLILKEVETLGQVMKYTINLKEDNNHNGERECKFGIILVSDFKEGNLKKKVLNISDVEEVRITELNIEKEKFPDKFKHIINKFKRIFVKSFS